MRMNNIEASFSIPPLSRYAKTSHADNDLTPGVDVLSSEAGKVYIIQKIYLTIQNTAGTSASYINLYFVDFWTGKSQNVVCYITPNQVGTEQLVLDNLNMPTQPGSRVYVICDAAPSTASVRLWYQEVTL